MQLILFSKQIIHTNTVDPVFSERVSTAKSVH